jgi:hypothetical protein
MAEHEQFYFDHPEKMEYPTVTWAAQEMRKGNVLRLAARHVEEPLRSRFQERGSEFAERAWSDLLRFDSRFTTRPLAIMMREGTVDLYLRQHPLSPVPRPDRHYDFGKPEEFIPQKERVKRMLKSPRGLLRIGLRLLNPVRWWSFWRRGSWIVDRGS